MLITFYCSQNAVYAIGKWVKTAESINRYYMDASAYDTMHCAALSNFGYMYGRLELSDDGGNTWRQVLKYKDIFLDPENLGGPIRLISLDYPSPNLIICGGTGTWILRSDRKSVV